VKSVLVLGAGLVSGPLVRYLLGEAGCRVTVADIEPARARRLVEGYPNGAWLEMSADNERELGEAVVEHDLVVSLLPYAHHVRVAGHCLRQSRPLVTTSYVSEEMRALDAAARDAGVLLLNEVGLDPGIDHMSAMALIHRVQEAGGRVTHFRSYCGGLPGPEANNNPLGYKFSWSPKGVVMAGRNDARYLDDGKEVFVPGRELFGHRWRLEVPGQDAFEAYPNRDSLPYVERYGLAGIRTMLRGTLRYPGWCETLKAIADLDLLDDRERDDLADLTCADWVRECVSNDGDLRRAVSERLGVSPDAPVVVNLAWLGFFNDEPVGIERGSNLDILAKLMLDRMAYRPGERDMVVLHHEFEVEHPGEVSVPVTSTLVVLGEPDGESAMARTVGLPAAIAARLILDGRLRLTGVQIPVSPEIYRPVLEELARFGIACIERDG